MKQDNQQIQNFEGWNSNEINKIKKTESVIRIIITNSNNWRLNEIQ